MEERVVTILVSRDLNSQQIVNACRAAEVILHDGRCKNQL